MPIDVIRTQTWQNYDRSGRVIDMVRVTWYADKDHGPFIDNFPAETSGYDMRQALEARAAQLNILRGV